MSKDKITVSATYTIDVEVSLKDLKEDDEAATLIAKTKLKDINLLTRPSIDTKIARLSEIVYNIAFNRIEKGLHEIDGYKESEWQDGKFIV